MDNGAFGELYQVKINGLWGKSNITFDLYKDSNILIGENGIGKTTALKILESILDLNFIHTAKYVFDSIEFVFDTEEVLKVELSDFLVSKPTIIDAFDKIYNGKNTKEKILRAKFEKLVDELFEKNLIGRFLSGIYHEKYTSEIMQTISDYMPVNLLKTLKNGFEFYKSPKDEFGDSAPIISYAQTNFIKSKVAQKVAGGVYNAPIFNDMVSKVKFYYGDESFVRYHYTDRIVDPNKEYKYTFWKCDTESEIAELLSQCEKNALRKSIKNKNLCYNGKYIERLFDDDLEHTTLEILKIIKDKTGYFDINSAIRSDWYSFEDIGYLNFMLFSGAYEYSELIKSKEQYTKEEATEIVGYISSEMLRYHKYYVLPLLADESPFKINLEKIVTDVRTYLEEDLYDEYFIDCVRLLKVYIKLHNLIPKTVDKLSIRTSDLLAYESFVKEFIEDKQVFVVPAGLFLCLTDDVERYNCIDYFKFEYTIKLPISKISSGEAKILALAFFILNSNSAILIMDEPELSTSILWQERMLPTIIDYGNFNSVIVATHSPYMVRDDSLKDYIEYLP